VPPGEVQRLFLAAIKGTPGVLAQPAPDVNTIGFNDRGVEYRVRYWTASFDRRDPLDGAVRDRLWYALQRAGHGVPAALRHIYMHESSERTRGEEQVRAADAREGSLRVVDIFRDLPKEALRAVAQGTERRMYCAGELVIEEGSEGSELFVVESGEVEVLVARERGEPARVAVLGKGRFFGEMSLMTGERRRASVRTTTDTVLLVVDKSDFQPVLESNAALAQRISSLLAERELGLGEAQSRDPGERKSMVEQRSDALLQRIRAFFSL
jgi:CRP-like cAMP-binding protein